MLKLLRMKGKAKRSVVDSLLCSHEAKLCIFSDGYEKGCIIKMHQSLVVLVIAMLSLRDLLLHELDEVVVFKKA